jgi:uncharacterized membrane protein YfcA
VGAAEALAIFAAAVAAGAINAVVGSGSLITFPTLLAFGFPAVVANVSNNVGLVSGNVSGALVLILVACVLVLVQPRLNAWMAARRGARDAQRSPVLGAGVLVSGAYGGYFGAAQGVLVIGLLGSFLDDDLQRVNAAKNVLVAMVNATAAVVFILFAHVNWVVVLLIAVGSTAGGLLGARVGRRLPPLALRIFIVIIGVISAVKLIFF